MRSSTPQEPPPAAPDGWRGVLYRWFVEYNPCYFASALCVLAGVLLLARELPPDAFGSKLKIVASTEVYQVLLIAGAALLLRAGLRRPATILGISALLFLLDAAFNGERIISYVGQLSLEPGMRARRAVPASICFALFSLLKLWALARVFRLRSAAPALAVTAVTLGLLPFLPYAIELAGPTEARRQPVYLALFWLGAPLLGWALTRSARRWTSDGAAEGPGHVLMRRVAAALPFVVAAMFVAHGFAWTSLSDLPLSPAQASPYLLVASCVIAGRLAERSSRKAELAAWIGAGASLCSGALAPASTGLWPLAVSGVLTGTALVALGHAARLRLFLPAAVCLFGGAYALSSGSASPLPPPHVAWPAGLAAALLAGAWRDRDFRCLFASALAAGVAVALLAPASYGALAAGVWLAATSWILFPELRRWVPFAATVGVLALGAWMAWRGAPGMSIGTGACALGAIGVGFSTHRLEFQAAGGTAGAILAALKHELWIPRTSGGWGFALVAGGILLLVAGVAINLALAARRPRPDPSAAP